MPNLPTPITSVATPGNLNPGFVSSLPPVPTPQQNVPLPNGTPSADQAGIQRMGGSAPQTQTLTAAQVQQMYGTLPDGGSGGTGATGETLTAAQVQQQYGGLPDGTGAAGPTGDTGPTGDSGGGVSSGLAGFAKGIFGAPATLLARPFQAAAELAGATSDQVDSFTKNIPGIGGLIAPVDQNAGDVLKDVGRGAETAALGIGEAPIAAGALFGAGSSVEQGNPILSAQTALDTALGAGGGKVLDWVGKPLLNTAGKVIGTITPQIIKDVAAGGAKAIQTFAAEHDLPLGLQKIATPVAGAIQKTASGIDAGINKTVSTTAGALKGGIAAQYPGIDPVAHYTALNEHDIAQPTTVNEPRFAKATAIYNNAADKGINLEQQATKLGIQHDQLAEGSRYNTMDTVDNIRNGNYQVSNDVIRPAIQEVQHGIPRISTADVKNSILNNIDSISNSQISPEDRAYMKTQVEKQYAPGSAADKAHPDGYNLEDLHDSRIVSQANGKYKVDGSALENRPARLSRLQGSVFSDLFDSKAPSELQGVRGELEKNFKLANYLEALHGKSVPQGITQKAVRLFGRAIGGMAGGHFGGFPGFLFGSRGGDMLFNAFETLPNPIKSAVLTKAFANKAEPAAFQALSQHLGQQEAERLMRPGLPAAGESSGGAPASPTLFSTPGGQAAPDLQTAVDMAAAHPSKVPNLTQAGQDLLTKIDAGNGAPAFISNNLRQIASENGVKITDTMTPQDVIKGLRAKGSVTKPAAATTPTTNTKSPLFKAKVLAAGENSGPYTPPSKLSSIDLGDKGTSKFSKLPVADGAPAVHAPPVEVLPDPKNLPTIDFGSKAKSIRRLNDIKF